MSKKSIGEVLRYMASHAITHEECDQPLRAIVYAMEESANIHLEELLDLEERLKKKMTASYVATTINRMKELKEIGKVGRVKFYTNDETGQKHLRITLKDGVVKERKPIGENATFHAGMRKGVELMAEFVPDFIDYTPEDFAIAQKIVKQYRDHAAKVNGGEA